MFKKVIVFATGALLLAAAAIPASAGHRHRGGDNAAGALAFGLITGLALGAITAHERQRRYQTPRFRGHYAPPPRAYVPFAGQYPRMLRRGGGYQPRLRYRVPQYDCVQVYGRNHGSRC